VADMKFSVLMARETNQRMQPIIAQNARMSWITRGTAVLLDLRLLSTVMHFLVRDECEQIEKYFEV